MPASAWDTCSASPDCGGAALGAEAGRCLAHLKPEEDLAAVLDRCGGTLDARGVRIDGDLLARIVSALPRAEAGAPRLERAKLDCAILAEEVDFGGFTIGDQVSFEGARFERSIVFDRCEFGDSVSFRHATLKGPASFKGATFGRNASFTSATFATGASFDQGSFGDGASFVGATVVGAGTLSFQATTFGRDTRFDGAVLGARANFREARFADSSSFRKTIFGDKASFERTSFGDEASFSRSKFGDGAQFADAAFGNGISFRDVPFGNLAGFQRVSFGDRAWYTAASFGAGASFARATFRGLAGFSETRFNGPSKFEEATFAGRVRFDRALFAGRVSFRLATFDRARTVGPLVALGLITFDQACFTSAADIQVSADRLTAVRATFRDGVTLRIRWAKIALDLAEFGAPSLLSAAAPFADLNESELTAILTNSRGGPLLASVRGANLADLIVANIDLRCCRFIGAHNLERLRLEGDAGFATSPRWRGTRREVIAEEQEWRASRTSRLATKWQPPAPTFPIEGAERIQALAPRAIASIYRALRKGREDAGDAPGAADFYFGEMEMRRHDERANHSERATIYLYWLVSGYGLRSMRALIALFVTIAIFAVLFWRAGFAPGVDFTRALFFSAESTSSLFRVPETPGHTLTTLGEALQIGLRLLGPLFFGLALLSLRGRIKR